MRSCAAQDRCRWCVAKVILESQRQCGFADSTDRRAMHEARMECDVVVSAAGRLGEAGALLQALRLVSGQHPKLCGALTAAGSEDP